MDLLTNAFQVERLNYHGVAPGLNRKEKKMAKKNVKIELIGQCIELCVGILSKDKKAEFQDYCRRISFSDEAVWYGQSDVIKKITGVENWWGINQLDHAVGFLFSGKEEIETFLELIMITVDGEPAVVNIGDIQVDLYTPEVFPDVGSDDRIVCHGAVRTGTQCLKAKIDDDFNASQLTLSFQYYKGYGYILIDMDYDGSDDYDYDFTDESFLDIRFGKRYADIF